MSGNGFREFVDDGGTGDAVVGGDGEGVAGVVVEPAQDFHMSTVAQPPVGEVGLPAFVGLFGGEPDVGRLRPFLRAGLHEASRGEVAADRGDRHHEVVGGVPGARRWCVARCRVLCRPVCGATR